MAKHAKPLVKTGYGLSSLRSLVRAHKEMASTIQTPSSSIGHLNSTLMDHEMDVYTCIQILLADNRGRNMLEVFRGIQANYENQQLMCPYNSGDVEEALNLMVRDATLIPTNGSSAINRIYNLNKRAIMSLQSQRPILKKPTMADHLKGIDPLGLIIPSEGIERCIYKVMSDHKRRTLSEIQEILLAYGINREITKDAVIKAKVNRRWFNDYGRGTQQQLELKKSIKMPPAIEIDLKQLNAKFSPGSVVSLNLTKTVQEPTVHQPALPTYAQLYNHDTNASTEAAAIKVEAVLDKAPPVEVQQPTLVGIEAAPTKVTPAIAPGDDLPTAIWKTMSDYKPYPASEIQLLLDAAGFNGDSARARLSSLHARGWFDRQSIPGSRSFTYILRRDIPMPEASQLSKLSKTLDDLAEQAAAPVKNIPQPIEKEPVMVTAPISNVTPIVAAKEELKVEIINLDDLQDTALLKFNVSIKNQTFSFVQAGNLTRELVKMGFGLGTFVDAESSFLKTTRQIRNQPFTDKELDELAAQLLSAGFAQDCIPQ